MVKDSVKGGSNDTFAMKRPWVRITSHPSKVLFRGLKVVPNFRPFMDVTLRDPVGNDRMTSTQVSRRQVIERHRSRRICGDPVGNPPGR
jgi:hypothetical protein